METLLPVAARIGALLKERGETVAISESSAGGLVSAALLAVPGASAFFMGGAVVYTRRAGASLLQITSADMAGIRSASEPYAMLLARTMRTRLGATWGLTETGAAGPTGNRYGDAAGHSCIAVCGPAANAGMIETAITIETGRGERLENMRAFSVAALDLLEKSLA